MPGVRDRARRRARRRGGQPDAQDARGAGVVRAPDPAHRPARRGAADDPLALPAGPLRRAHRRGGGPRARGAGGGPETALACARLSLGDAERARELAGRRGWRCAPRPSGSRARPSRARWRARTVGGPARGGPRPRRGDPRGARGERRRGARAVPAQGAQADRDRVDGADPARPPAGRDRRARPRAAARLAVVRRPRLPGVGRRGPGAQRRPAGRARGRRRRRSAAPAGRDRAGRGHAAAVSAECVRGACVRGARLPIGARSRHDAAGRVPRPHPRATVSSRAACTCARPRAPIETSSSR